MRNVQIEENRIVLIGGGGHCESVLDALYRSGTYEEMIILDPACPQGSKIMDSIVAGDDGMLPVLKEQGYGEAFITIGSIKSSRNRRNVYARAKEIGFHFPCVIDTSAVISDTAILGNGTFVGKNAVVNACALIGEQVIINTGVIVEHDCRIGSFSHLAIGATVCGGVEIGNDVFVGANATIVQGVKIKDSSVIGAGSIILGDVPENLLVTGVWKGD